VEAHGGIEIGLRGRVAVARRSIEGDAQHSGGHTTRDGGKKIQTAKGGAARRGQRCWWAAQWWGKEGTRQQRNKLGDPA